MESTFGKERLEFVPDDAAHFPQAAIKFFHVVFKVLFLELCRRVEKAGGFGRLRSGDPLHRRLGALSRFFVIVAVPR